MIEIEKLSLCHERKNVLHNLTFTSSKNLGIIGESGSGKSSLLKSLIALFPHSHFLQAEKLRIDGVEVLNLSVKDLQYFRRRVSYVSADIYGSFYPLSDIGCIFDEILSYHSLYSKKERKMRSLEMMERLGLKDLDLMWHSYIRELSGGMARRVQLALSLVCGAECLLCDEITSSLDDQNIQKLISLLQELKIPLVIVTHDLSFLEKMCDEVVVLEGGRILEYREIGEFFEKPFSSYGRQLVEIYKCLK